jgi:hypothetical protein
LSATPANAPFAAVPTVNISRKRSCSGAVLIRSCAAGTSRPEPPTTTTPTPSTFSLCAIATCSGPGKHHRGCRHPGLQGQGHLRAPSATSPTATKTVAESVPPTNPK